MMERKLYLGPLTDNRRWDRIILRPDDVIVVTPPKCGTTWMQAIVALLLSGDPEAEMNLSVNMPWVDIRFREISVVADPLEAAEHRRSMKSHTPMDGLPYNDRATFICVFRHPLDAHFSFRNHARNIPLTWFDHWYPEDDTDGVTFKRFLDGGPEGYDMDLLPLAHILRHYEAARAVADRPNVGLFHYADMKRDLPGTFDRVAALMGITHAPELMERLVAVAEFDTMRAQAERFAPGNFRSGQDFFHKGTNGQWHGHLNDAEFAAYDAIMDAALAPDARAWLEYGAAGSRS